MEEHRPKCCIALRSSGCNGVHRLAVISLWSNCHPPLRAASLKCRERRKCPPANSLPNKPRRASRAGSANRAIASHAICGHAMRSLEKLSDAQASSRCCVVLRWRSFGTICGTGGPIISLSRREPSQGALHPQFNRPMRGATTLPSESVRRVR